MCYTCIFYTCNTPKTPHIYYRCRTTGHERLNNKLLKKFFFSAFKKENSALFTLFNTPTFGA